MMTITNELHRVVQLENQVCDLLHQVERLQASNNSLRAQPKALVLNVSSAVNRINEAMETLRRSARDHNEMDAVRVIDDALESISNYVCSMGDRR